MRKIYWISGIIFILLLAVITANKKPTVTINEHTFNLYVAKNPKDKKIGLSKYDNIPQNYAMIFLLDKPDFYSFWMKDMKFPIDIIFIKNKRIVTIHRGVKPPKNPNDRLPLYNSKEPSDTVLEINAGLSEKYNFKENDLVKISNL